jgi:hypothetical protein
MPDVLNFQLGGVFERDYTEELIVLDVATVSALYPSLYGKPEDSDAGVRVRHPYPIPFHTRVSHNRYSI